MSKYHLASGLRFLLPTNWDVSPETAVDDVTILVPVGKAKIEVRVVRPAESNGEEIPADRLHLPIEINVYTEALNASNNSTDPAPAVRDCLALAGVEIVSWGLRSRTTMQRAHKDIARAVLAAIAVEGLVKGAGPVG